MNAQTKRHPSGMARGEPAFTRPHRALLVLNDQEQVL